jgi:hypothetical protein
MSDNEPTNTVGDVTLGGNLTVHSGYTNVLILMVFFALIGVCLYIPGLAPGDDDTTLTYPIWVSSIVTTMLVTSYTVNTHGANVMSAFASLVFVFALPNIGIGLILETFPGWITPFSNTIGYFFSNMIDGDEINSKFKAEVKDKITQFAIDPSVILNSISPKDIGEGTKIESLVDALFGTGKSSGKIDPMNGGTVQIEQQIEQPIEQPTHSTNDFQSLIKRFVIRKDRIAYAVWVFLISSLTSSIAARMIVDSGS